MECFLIGGGRDTAAHAATHGPFVAASTRRSPGALIVAYVLDEGDATDPGRWADTLRGAGAPEVRCVVVSPGRPPRAADLEDAGGIYVAGGLTPGYRDVLTADLAWLEAAREAGLPYAGFSAGAAIAAERAVVGGWRASLRGRDVAVVD